MPFLGSGHLWIVFLILVIVLIVWGPGKLPEVGGAIGRGIREFRKASSDLTDEIKRSAEGKSAAPESPQVQETKPADTSKPTDAAG